MVEADPDITTKWTRAREKRKRAFADLRERFAFMPNVRRTWSGSFVLAILFVVGVSATTALGLFFTIMIGLDFPKVGEPLSELGGSWTLSLGIFIGIICTLVAIANQWFFADLYDVVHGLLPDRIRWTKLFFTVFVICLALAAVPISFILYQETYATQEQHSFVVVAAESIKWVAQLVKDTDGGLLGLLAAILAVAGFMLTVRQLKDFHERIYSFEDFLERLKTLCGMAKPEDPLLVISYTPAVGYLAQHEAKWIWWTDFLTNKEGGEHKARIITLEQRELESWHWQFKGRKTRRGRITSDIIRNCTDTCSEIKDLLGNNYIEVKRNNLPGWYGYFTSQQAIIVTPFFLPISTIDSSQTERSNLQSPGMIGYETTDRSVIDKLTDQFAYISDHHRLPSAKVSTKNADGSSALGEQDESRSTHRTNSIQRKVEEALIKVLPAMEADGGGVGLEHIEYNAVHLKFKGACRDCPSQELTIEQTLKPALRAALPPEVKIIIE